MEMLSDQEIRAKAAEISVNATAIIVAALELKYGNAAGTREIKPLLFADDIAEYIRTGSGANSASVDIFRMRK